MHSLIIKNVSVAYAGTLILSDISVAIPRGTLVAVVGPNGAGKTTLIKAIVQLVPLVGGVIMVNGKPYRPSDNAIAYVPQRSGIDWDFPISVLDLVLMGCYARLGFMRRPGAGDRAAALEALAQVDLVACANQHIGELSGGQQQRALVARALLQDAPIFLLDEPLAGIDASAELLILAVLKQLAAQGKTVVMVHHQIQQVYDNFDLVLLLNRSCVAFGKAAQLLVPELLQATYSKQL